MTLNALGPCCWVCLNSTWIGSLLLTLYALGPCYWACVVTLVWVPTVDPLCTVPLCGYFWIGSLLLTLYALGPCRWACVDIIWIGSLLLTLYALGPWCWAYVDTLEWVPAVDSICVRPLFLGLSGYFGSGSLLYALGACCWACMDITKLGPCQRR